MLNCRQVSLNSQENYFHIVNNSNSLLGQEEDDFQKAFNQTFKKGRIINVVQDENQELDSELYFMKCTDSFIQKENVEHIFLNEEDFKSKDDIQSIILINSNPKEKESAEKNKVLESDVKGSDKEIKNIEINNNYSIEQEKFHKFRIYNSKDFVLFHPWKNIENLNQIEENLLKEEKKLNNNRFKISKVTSRKTKRKLKAKKKRKEKPDDIRKKIKSRFLKAIKIRINQLLKSAKSKLFFDYLPQCFICSISKEKNKPFINMTFKELFSQKFYEEDKKVDKTGKEWQIKRNRDKKKYDNNVKVLRYLEKNQDICIKSTFNIIGNITFKDMFNEYLKSEEFEKEIEKLKTENNTDNYINDYIIKAHKFVNYFLNEK